MKYRPDIHELLDMRVVAAAVLTLATTARSGAAQATFTACYVPDVGAMYLVGVPGLPPTCLSKAHEQIKWSESGNGTVTIQNGSVTTTKLANNAVTAEKIAHDAVESRHIRDGTVGAEQVASESLDGKNIAPKSIRAEDIAYHYRLSAPNAVSVAAGASLTITTGCAVGREVLGGGWHSDPPMTVERSFPVGPNTSGNGGYGWQVRVSNDLTVPVDITVYALCADVN